MISGLKTAIANKPDRRRVEDKLTSADRVKIKIDRHALLLRGAPIAALISFSNALITLAIGWNRMDRLTIGVWAGAVILLSLVRLFVWRQFSRKSHTAQGLLKFTRWHVASMGLNGVLWGSLAPIFALSDMLSNAFLPFVIAGMTAAALASAGASWKSVLAFNVPSLAALAVSYVLFGGPDGVLIALVIVLYGVAAAYLAFTTQQMIERSIRLRSRNDNLLKALTRQVDAANEAEQRYRALVEASSDITLIFSPDGKVIYASPSAEPAFGAPPQNLLGMTTKQMVHPDDIEHFREVGGKSLSQIGEATPLSHVCMRAQDCEYVALSGRLTNMLYVPGVEGIVFSGGRVKSDETCHLPAAE
ncbi:MAG: PAS domain S-box protein [Parvularculaceae bacterium]|nr:PAS domain S-box protein [Parvularculaceae bacterium]